MIGVGRRFLIRNAELFGGLHEILAEKAAWGRVCGRAKLLRRDASLPAAKAAGLSAFSIVGLTV